MGSSTASKRGYVRIPRRVKLLALLFFALAALPAYGAPLTRGEPMPHGLWQPRTSMDGRPQPWRCRLTMADGTRKVVSTRQKELGAARESYKRLQRAAARGEDLWGPRPAPLAEVLEGFIASRRAMRSPATVSFYVAKAAQLKKLLGDTRDVNRLKLEDLEGYVGARRAAGVHDRTIVKELGTLRAAMRRARRSGLVRVELHRIWPDLDAQYVPGTRWLHPGELERVLAKLPERRRQVVELLVYTGARDAEWNRLKLCHINWRDRLLELPGTKTEGARRAIPFAEHPALAELLRQRAPARIGGRLFSHWTNIRRDLRRACELAKVPSCSPNDLRRTFATWLRIAGVEVDRIAKLLGHANSRLVEKVYGQLPPEALANDIGRAFAHAVARGTGRPAPLPTITQAELEQAVLGVLARIQAQTRPEALS